MKVIISSHWNVDILRLHLQFHMWVGNSNPLQYSCLENPWAEKPGRLQSMGSPKSWTQLSIHTHTHTHTHTQIKIDIMQILMLIRFNIFFLCLFAICISFGMSISHYRSEATSCNSHKDIFNISLAWITSCCLNASTRNIFLKLYKKFWVSRLPHKYEWNNSDLP